ncbi:uncharacterized protein LOC101240962 isoform X1 [Hydra vulgaris]|uniref:uncharacterized protein LOC101240962 isoform X1 n=1 Tax=Hydra vulgaris TaxID=6087 RepID=UPI001F5FD05B|nr:uncharacterized protein LOC101240962 isoform X2 [Hydra vulgaris]
MNSNLLDNKSEDINGKGTRKWLLSQLFNFFSIKVNNPPLKEVSNQQVAYQNHDLNESVKIVKYENTSFQQSSKEIFIDAYTFLHIFSYLDVFSLCQASQVCISWWNLSNDCMLWEEKLCRNFRSWHFVDYLSHPDLVKKENPNLSAKEIYIRCCPENNKVNNSNIHLSFTSLSYYFGFSTPRIVMFGSGLNSKGLVKRLLWDKQSPFTVKGMFPGQFEGYGSGVTLQCINGTFNLITLYSQTKNIREQHVIDGENKPRSKLLVRRENENDYVLSQPVKELCTMVDAFIYIIKATTEEELMLSMDEFQAIIDERWLQPQSPLLVLCVSPDANVMCIPVLHVANKLKLINLSRRWQVRQCFSNSLAGILPGISWLAKQIY